MNFRRRGFALPFLVLTLLALFAATSPFAWADVGAVAMPAGTYGNQSLGGLASADLGTGAATASLPIQLPSVRGGLTVLFQGLTYNGRAGRQGVGDGWTIGVPSIERHNFGGPPQYRDPLPGEKIDGSAIDSFAFAGSRLVPICSVKFGGCPALETMPPWAFDWHYFRLELEREGSFLRFFWSPTGKTWRIEYPSGEIAEYGEALTYPSLPSGGLEGERGLNHQHDGMGGNIFPPFRWLPVRQFTVEGGFDTPSNPIVYRWERDRRDDRAYLVEVWDTPKKGGQLSLNTYAHHVRLFWSFPWALPGRSDSPEALLSHAPIERKRPEKLLSRVEIASANFKGDARELTRKYHLSYEKRGARELLVGFRMEGRCLSPTPEQPTSEKLGSTGEHGRALPSTECPSLPETKLVYTKPALTSAVVSIATSDGSPVPSPKDVALMDVNADGLPDVVTPRVGGYYYDAQPLWFTRAKGLSPVLEPSGIAFAVEGIVTRPASLFSASSGFTLTGEWTTDGRVSALFSFEGKNYESVLPYRDSGGAWKWSRNNFTHGVELGTPQTSENQLCHPNKPDSEIVTDMKWISLVGDFDSDGLVDLRTSQITKSCKFGDTYLGREHFLFSSRRGDGKIGYFNRPSEFKWELPTTEATRVADLDGDGVNDLAFLDSEGVFWYPGHASGYFGCEQGSLCASSMPPRVQPMPWDPNPSNPRGVLMKWGNMPPPAGYNHARAHLHDVNGDGFSDFVLEGDKVISVWKNVDGVSFGNPSVFEHPAVRDGVAPGVSRLLFGDMDGTGTDDIVVFTGKSVTAIVFYVGDHVGDQNDLPPGVLMGIDNGVGAQVHIDYARSAVLEEAARNAGKPWTSHVPTALQVVSRVTARTTLAAPRTKERVTEYVYADPAYDGWRRSFLGFGKVRVVTPGDDDAPGSIQETLFQYNECQRVGGACEPATRVWDPERVVASAPVVTKTMDAKELPLSLTHYGWWQGDVLAAENTPMVGMDSVHVRYAYVSVTDTLLYDYANGETGPSSTIEFVDVDSQSKGGKPTKRSVTVTKDVVHLQSTRIVDNNGNATDATDKGCIAGCRAVDKPITRSVTWTQTSPETEWTWRDASRTERGFHGDNADGFDRVSRSEYDTAGHLLKEFRLHAGQAPLDRRNTDPAKGKAEVPSTASDDGEILLANNTYDPVLGTLSKSEGPNGACSRVGYDAAYGHLPTAKITATSEGCLGGIGSAYEYDRGFEKVTMSVAPSGATALMEYDTFARLKRSWDPPKDGFLPDTSGLPSALVEYPIVDGVQLVSVSRRTETRAYAQEITYLDGFGEAVLSLRQADTSAGDEGNWIASGLPTRSRNGKIVETFAPWFYSGDPFAHPLTADSARTSLGRAKYDAFGRVTDTWGRDKKRVEHHEYHAISNVAFDADDPATGGVTRVYDGHGRLTVVAERGKNGASRTVEEKTTSFTYLAGGELAQVVQTNGTEKLTRWMLYDSFGRLLVNAEPNTSENFFADRPTSLSDARLGSLRSWRYAYDDAGHLVGTSDARGCGKNLFYDVAGRLLAEDVSPCSGAQPAYTKPHLGTGEGTEAFYTYDAPEAGQTEDFGFHAAVLRGQLAARSDRGAHVRFAYDARGQGVGVAKQIARPGEASSGLASRYASTWFRASADYDEVGRVTRETTGADVDALKANGASDVFYRYSGRGVLAGVTSSYGTLVAGHVRDAEGRTVSTTYGDGATTKAVYDYDTLTGRLHTFTLGRAAMPIASPPEGYVAPPALPPSTMQKTLESLAFDYDDVGNIKSVADNRTAAEWPDGAKPVSRTIGYDDFYRVTSIAYAHGGDTQVSPFESEMKSLAAPNVSSAAIRPVPLRNLMSRVTRQAFDYDWKGNTKKTEDDQSSFYDRSLGPIVNGEALGRPNQLVSASETGGALSVHYSAAGEITDLLLTRTNGCSGAAGKCTHRFVYDWDEVGNLARARRWDYAEAPTTELWPLVPEASAVVDLRYTYGAGGDRILKSAKGENGERVYAVDIFASLRLAHATWDASRLEYERTADTETVYLAGGLGRVVSLKSGDGVPSYLAGQRVFLTLGDRLGSTSSVIDRATGELVEHATYQAFGAPETDYRPERWGAFREAFRFTGKEDDSEVGITYFGARYYHAQLGRWMSADPLTIHGAGADLNPYAYVSGNVVNVRDRFGLCGEKESNNPCTATNTPNTQTPQPGVQVGSGHPSGGKSVFDDLGDTWAGHAIGDAKDWLAGAVSSGWGFVMGEGPSSPPMAAIQPNSNMGDTANSQGLSINWWRFVDPSGAAYGTVQSAKIAADPNVAWDMRLAHGALAASVLMPLTKSLQASVVTNARLLGMVATEELIVAEVAGAEATYAEGAFSPLYGRGGYPTPNGARPLGPVNLIEGAEYDAARSAANNANRTLHRANPQLAGMQIHEVQPVQFGGSPTAMTNKMAVTPGAHQAYSAWWSDLAAWVRGKL